MNEEDKVLADAWLVINSINVKDATALYLKLNLQTRLNHLDNLDKAGTLAYKYKMSHINI